MQSELRGGGGSTRGDGFFIVFGLKPRVAATLHSLIIKGILR